MNIQLIKGEFSVNDAYSLIRQLILEKIKYHENKITYESSEEDIKSRESKIKHLQNELSMLLKNLSSTTGSLKIESTIDINKK
jgi:hypothetical protein